MADSTILVKSPDGWKVKATLGLGILTVIVILAFMYHFQVGIIVLVTGLGIGARVWVWAVHQHRLAGFERRRWLADVIKAEAEAEAAKARSYFVETNTGVFVLDGIAISQFYPAVQASRLLADASALLPETAPPVKRLLDIKFDHILIVGPTRSGKTTVANHLIDAAEYDATIYALDPHATQNRLKGLSWSPRAQVIGDGRDWAAIDAMLVNLLGEMHQRFGQPIIPPPLYVANDEWLVVRKHCAHANEFFEKFGSEAAKVNMHLIVATQASTVDDLGCSADVRDNLVELRLSHASKSENKGLLRWGRGRDTVETVELPGKYKPLAVPLGDRVAFAPVVRLPEPEDEPETTEPEPVNTDPTKWHVEAISLVPTGDELRVCELWDKGASLRAIWKEVYGTEFGGNQADKLKGILVKWGRVSSE